MAYRNFVRPLGALGAVAIAVVVAAPASANNRPAVTVTPTVTGTTVDVQAGVNRGMQAIASCTYVLDTASAMGCGRPNDGGKKASSFDIGLSGLQGGSHAVAVTIVLTDGGGATSSASFTVVSGPRIFALAFSNLDGVPGYDPNGDVLIAKLVDTNADALLDVGDTVFTDRYPTDFGPTSFGTFTVTSHVVAHVLTATSTSAIVTDFAGRQYTLDANSSDQRYLEATAGSPRSEVSIFDSMFGSDTIHAQLGAPSHPDTAVEPRLVGGDASDGRFIDVVIDMS